MSTIDEKHWPQFGDRLTGQLSPSELEWLVTDPTLDPHDAYLLINHCKGIGRADLAMTLCRGASLTFPSILWLLSAGREVVLAANSYRSHEGEWWKYTETLKNPILDRYARNPELKTKIDDLVGCDYREVR